MPDGIPERHTITTPREADLLTAAAIDDAVNEIEVVFGHLRDPRIARLQQRMCELAERLKTGTTTETGDGPTTE